MSSQNIKDLERSLDIARKSGDKLELAGIYLKLGSAHGKSGDRGKAIEYYERSLDIAKSIPKKKGEHIMGGLEYLISSIVAEEYQRSGEFYKSYGALQQSACL